VPNSKSPERFYNWTRLDTDFQDMKNKALAERIIKIFYKVYSTLEHDFFQKIYENVMMIEFRKASIPAESQSPTTQLWSQT
jgi:hypothetical protein